MEHVKEFNNLLAKTVNLPDGKLDSLEDRSDKIYAAIKAADSDLRVLSKKRQGSWAQRTIINPPEGVEFDADFMLELDENTEWSPSDYSDAVFEALNSDPVYGDMQTPVKQKNRCIRVTYANDMHVDVVPYVKVSNRGESIINTDTDEWEDNDAIGFTKWMKEKDDLTDGNMRRVIRLLKYLRNNRGWYEDTVSIILTTIVGNAVKPENVLANADCYNNVPVTLARIVSDLAQWALSNETQPDVEADGTVFTHRWDETKYQQFRTDIQDLDSKIAAALAEPDEDESLAMWQDLFGTGFKAAEAAKKSGKFPAVGTVAGGGASTTDPDTSSSRSGKAG